MITRNTLPILAAALGLLATAACASDSPTAVPEARTLAASLSANDNGIASGERTFGKVTVEPAYDADSGELIFLLTPDKAPNPSKANAKATSPLYLVEYPASTTVTGTFNCVGVPGNCPSHDLAVAGAATQIMPSVYGTNPYLVPGHDHVVDAPGAPDFNVAWEVILVLFTNQAAANTRLTTEAQIEAAVAAGNAIEVDAGFAFNCSVVPASVFWKATPVS